MNLTNDDLQAIKQLIDSSIDERVPAIVNERVQTILDERVPAIIDERVPRLVKPIIEEAIEDSKRHTAAGFAEVHQRLDDLQDTVDEIRRVQNAEIKRVDRQSLAITKMRKAFKSV